MLSWLLANSLIEFVSLLLAQKPIIGYRAEKVNFDLFRYPGGGRGGGGVKNPGPILNNTLFAPFCKPFLPAVGGGAPIKEGYRKHFLVSFHAFLLKNDKKMSKNDSVFSRI
jgi:hypothetical protein